MCYGVGATRTSSNTWVSKMSHSTRGTARGKEKREGQTCRQADIDRETETQTERDRHRETDRQADRQR